MDDASTSVPPPDLPHEIRCHYQKGLSFRVARIAGVIGGVTPSGLLMTAFSEYPAFPTTDVLTVSPQTGSMQSASTVREGPVEIIRELEVCLSMDLSTAAAIHQWLGAHLLSIQKMADGERAPR